MENKRFVDQSLYSHKTLKVGKYKNLNIPFSVPPKLNIP
jgi:hypothetical protein